MKDSIKIISALRSEWNGGDHPNLYISGCGKVNAAMVTMEMIKYSELTQQPITTIINYGTAGSTTGVTGLVDCTKFVQRDMDVRPLGFALGETPFDIDPPVVDFSYMDNPIGKKLTCGTGDSFVTSGDSIDTDVVDMEAYAIAKVCYNYNIDFISYKYITDSGDPNDWEDNYTKGIKFFKELLEEHYDMKDVIPSI